jgi:hypothetical protein
MRSVMKKKDFLPDSRKLSIPSIFTPYTWAMLG